MNDECDGNDYACNDGYYKEVLLVFRGSFISGENISV